MIAEKSKLSQRKFTEAAPADQIPVNPEKKGLLGRLLNRKKEKNILFFEESGELASVNEVLSVAALFRKRHPEYRIHIITQEKNKLFFDNLPHFDSVHSAASYREVKKISEKIRPRALYVAGGNIRKSLMFIGKSRLIIGSGLPGWYVLITGIADLKTRKGLEKIWSKGFNLFPGIHEAEGLHAAAVRVPSGSGDTVLVNVFPSDPRGSCLWSLNHASRLLRLCIKDGIRVVVPVYSHTDRDQVSFLRSRVPQAQFVENCDTAALLKLLQKARLAAGARGEEMRLAHLTGTPVLMLDGYSKVARIDTAITVIRPSRNLDDCDDNCDHCEKGNCIDLISPERVHEAIQKILKPL